MDENVNASREGSSIGSIIGAIVVLALIAFGALYFMNNRTGDQAVEEESNGISTQSDSDAAANIEADLNATDIENVDYDLNEENFTSS
ncbi:MAG: hypothetical protein A2758_00685 [Candidatus Zambryskibacteria bacterium RIFCSPHIGHO2_01_FULL_49_18]|uniref:Uncharacterized protein n=2 Tax=Candidatus Zambryskiibacteriota TaxID=1817925 RepID=A0A1G2T2Y3_9BACT|nr:MAG: hypothetical protein A2758_00685 [Candidatus Zambryskibacteria bacterium RIFCSPHIGHO2_01_FULL_49_18]OHB05939.1 MAG: hypothetical protein A3A26_03270 [Candidatus Zambryskibacteria bacterium RIFCSPLOWO2_01_FULL_47_14]